MRGIEEVAGDLGGAEFVGILLGQMRTVTVNGRPGCTQSLALASTFLHSSNVRMCVCVCVCTRNVPD